jgi:universal stress protein A
MAVYQRILLAVDLSPDSLLIGRLARSLATALGAELGIVHVVEPVLPVAPIPPDVVVPVTTTAELVDIAQEQIGKLAQDLDVPQTRWAVVVGAIKNEIVRAAADGKMDLIVIGSRGRHGLAFLIKPTEDAVLHQAPCDVLAVHLPEEENVQRKSEREPTSR